VVMELRLLVMMLDVLGLLGACLKCLIGYVVDDKTVVFNVAWTVADH
jgi:hypothetical protein